VALHGTVELLAQRFAEVGQAAVQGVEPVEVAVAADGRAGAAVAGPVPVVAPLLSPLGELRRIADPLGQAGTVSGGRV